MDFASLHQFTFMYGTYIILTLSKQCMFFYRNNPTKNSVNIFIYVLCAGCAFIHYILTIRLFPLFVDTIILKLFLICVYFQYAELLNGVKPIILRQCHADYSAYVIARLVKNGRSETQVLCDLPCCTIV